MDSISPLNGINFRWSLGKIMTLEISVKIYVKKNLQDNKYQQVVIGEHCSSPEKI